MRKYVARGRKRTHQVLIRLNDIEYEKMMHDVTKMNVTMSQYFRDLILKTELKERPGYDFYEVMKQMSRIGVNLNQIAKKANTINSIDKEQYELESKNWNKFIREVKNKYL